MRDNHGLTTESTRGTASEPGRAGLYWRRGPRVTPGVMTLGSGELSFTTSDGELFRAPVNAIQATFGLFSTLTIRVGAATHRFVTGAYAGALAPPFTEQQLATLADDAGNAARSQFTRGAATLVSSSVIGSIAVLVGSIAGRSLGLVGNAFAVVKLFRSQHESFGLARAWAEYLQLKGVRIRLRGTTFARSQIVIAAIAIPAFVAFGIAVFVLVSTLSR